MDAVGLVADLIGIAGAVFALFAWLQARRLRETIEREKQRQNRKVTVVLQSGGRSVELPVEMRRAELSRAEILGRIGMIPMHEKGARFSLSTLNTPEFWRQISQVLESDQDALLTIPCTDAELRQFDLPR